jgi:hypothetical protein
VARRERGAAAHAGRLPYCHKARVLERADDGSITRAELALQSDFEYARIEVVDGNGRKAWTNALWP